MKPRTRDPLRLDVEPFAKEGGSLEGQWPLADLPRLAESTHAEAKPRAADLVSWSVRGELRPVRGDAPQIWLHLTARTRLGLECQRCLQPVAAELEPGAASVSSPAKPPRPNWMPTAKTTCWRSLARSTFASLWRMS
jgi:hypothetical protein